MIIRLRGKEYIEVYINTLIHKKMRTLAIIPARSGSKGLVDKNIIEIFGRPLLDYTIKAALESHCFDKIMVSTDSEYYATIAKECGAEVPFLRSEKNSNDVAGSWDVVREVLNQYAEEQIYFDYVMLLQPTSPLRNYKDIINVFKMLKDKEITNIVSVTEVEHPVQWCFTLDVNCSLENFSRSPFSQMRRQELEKHYRENGAIYLVDGEKIRDKDYDLYADQCYAYIMPRERSVDIDEYIDLVVCKEYLHNQIEK